MQDIFRMQKYHNVSPANFQKKLGKGMIIFAWLLLLGLLTLLFSKFLDQQQHPNQHLDSELHHGNKRVVVLKMNRAGHYLAPGKINNTPVTFLLDTGATDVAIPEKLAKRLGLEKGSRTMSQTANGMVKSYTTVLDSISIGSIEMYNIRASLFAGMPGGEILLGMSFLKHLDMQQKGDTLTLKH